MDPDLKQQTKLQDHKFGKYYFETLPKARGSTSHQGIGGEGIDMCEYKSHMIMKRIPNFWWNCH